MGWRLGPLQHVAQKSSSSVGMPKIRLGSAGRAMFYSFYSFQSIGLAYLPLNLFLGILSFLILL